MRRARTEVEVFPASKPPVKESPILNLCGGAGLGHDLCKPGCDRSTLRRQRLGVYAQRKRRRGMPEPIGYGFDRLA